MTEAADPSLWSQHGLPGLVIFALFVTLGIVIKLAFDRVENVSEKHLETHSKERDEWRQDSNKWRQEDVRRQDDTNRVLSELSNAIRDASRNRD